MANPIGVTIKQLRLGEDAESRKQWFSWIRRAGFASADVPLLTAETKRELEEAGLSIGSFEVRYVPQLFSRDGVERRERTVEVCSQIVDAATLGGKVCYMVLTPEDKSMPVRESFALFQEVFPTIVAEAEKHRIRIAIEAFPGRAPVYPTLGCTPEVLRAMFAAIPSPTFGINYDPSHLVRQGIDYLRFLREFAGRVAHVHAKDCLFNPEDVYLYGHMPAAFDYTISNSEGPWRYTIPGEGSINWQAVAFGLNQAGYRGTVSVELEDHRYRSTVQDRRRGLQKSLNYMRRYM